MASLQGTFSSQNICWTLFRLLIQTGFVSLSPQQCCRMWSDRYHSSLKATFPCSANCSRTVLDQTSSCCRLMSSCCSFALTPGLNTDRKKCLRSDADFSLIPPNKGVWGGGGGLSRLVFTPINWRGGGGGGGGRENKPADLDLDQTF